MDDIKSCIDLKNNKEAKVVKIIDYLNGSDINKEVILKFDIIIDEINKSFEEYLDLMKQKRIRINANKNHALKDRMQKDFDDEVKSYIKQNSIIISNYQNLIQKSDQVTKEELSYVEIKKENTLNKMNLVLSKI